MPPAGHIIAVADGAVAIASSQTKRTATVQITKHAQQRLSQRAIDMDAVSIALNLGLKIEQNGATVHFLGRRQCPRGLSRDEADGLEGTTVVLGRDGNVVTVYRTQRLPRVIRRRRPRRRSHRRTVSPWN